ncbi:MAG: DUF1565 domain-containing protein [Deltaproteobacteria bacterium]|nr:DUF1565 domain-containing protein [Deltaproteobacteria bacterium]
MRVALAIAVLVSACGAEPATHEGCGERCGPRFDACDERSIAIAGGGCEPVGVPDGACAKGFRSDGRGGCAAILPAAPCDPGSVAFLGEDRCHPIAPCGDGPWGSIPTDASTVFVDATNAGASDGTRERPFKTITEALAVAKIGAVVAVAAGRYAESLTFTRPVRLFGACPTKVEIAGSLVSPVDVELHDLAITGGGVLVGGKTSLDRVWVHDVSAEGVRVEPIPRGETAVVVRRSLIERASGAGVTLVGDGVTLEDVVVRGTRPRSSAGGLGVHVGIIEPTRPSTLRARGLVVEQVTGVGINVVASRAELDGALIRDVALRKDGLFGNGILVSDEAGKPRPALGARGVVIERVHVAGVIAHRADVSLSHLSLRDVDVDRDEMLGLGIQVTGDTELTLADSVIERVRYGGVFVRGARAVMERTIVRDVAAQKATGVGGVGVWTLVRDGVPPVVTVSRSRVLRTVTAGVFGIGGTLAVSECTIGDIAARPFDARFGDGVVISGEQVGPLATRVPGTLELSGTSIHGCARAGLSVQAAALHMRDSALMCNAIDLALSWRVAPDAEPSPFTLDDGGGNGCGCATIGRCVASPTELAPVEGPNL